MYKREAARPAPAAEEAAPLGLTMQSLLSMVGQMRSMAPDGAGPALTPKVTLSGNGLEIRLAGAGAPSPADAAAIDETAERLERIERTLKLLGARVAKMDATLSQSIMELEAQLGAQSEVVETLRAAVQQNEEMMETLADSMNIVDDLGQSDLRPELVFEPATIAS